MKKLLLFCCISIGISGCLSKKIYTAWKVQHTLPATHRKILVAVIPNDKKDSLKLKIGDGLVRNLGELGYNTVTIKGEFGPGGLSNLSQEATFIKLCDKGIDAVLTMTLINHTKFAEDKSGKFPINTSYYYYNRIWNYQKMQADLSEAESSKTRYIWECILFDLYTLEPLCVIQTKPFNPGKENKAAYIYKILDKMKKEGILVKQHPSPRKAF